MWDNSPQYYSPQPVPPGNRSSVMSDTQSVSSHHSGSAIHTGTMTHNSQHNPHYHHVLSPPPPTQIPSLTNILLNNSPGQFQSATQHPFLRLAGLGQLPKHVLSRWLSQDRLYAQAYIGFIGSLISRVDLPYAYVRDQSGSLRWRIVNLLTSALSNIQRELDFFASTAHEYGLDLESPPRNSPVFTAEPATLQYIDLFRAFWTDPSMTLLEGLVVLWATETVYLRAWTYAASFGTAPSSSAYPGVMSPSTTTLTPLTNHNLAAKSASLSPSQSHSQSQSQSHSPSTPGYSPSNYSSAVDSEGPIPVHSDYPSTATATTTSNSNSTPASHPSTSNNAAQTNDLDGGALRHKFIPNWTSPEFVAFVRDIADVTDLLAQRENAVVRKLEVYKAVWRHILDVESRFWPSV